MKMGARGRRKRAPIASINVIPYVDVMLVLLVIFMIATPLLKQGISVQLPHESAKVLPTAPPLIVSIDRYGYYYLNRAQHPTEPLNAQALTAQVTAQLLHQQASAGDSLLVYLRGDRRLDYGTVMHAMALLRKAGAQRVGLLTEPD